MLHRIPLSQHGPRAETMAKAVETCIHCGFCLPTCPTYELLGNEADSPRGRILLMKEVLEDKLEPSQAAPHIDRCLGCVACQTHCPSGVEYGNLLSSYRSLTSVQVTSLPNRAARLRRRLTALTLPYPKRFSLAMRLGQLGKRLQRFTPAALKPMLELVPTSLPAREQFAEIAPAVGPERGRVYLHLGCAASVLRPDITAAAVRVLTRHGITVRIPKAQQCCGALSWHIGDARGAQHFATANCAAFGEGDEPIISTAAGCGSGMHEYPLILAATEHQTKAQRFAERVVDISVYLAKLGIEPPPAVSPIKIAYHDACHLAHAQKVRQPPRQLLQAIPGIELVALEESELCCGSAGTYNIDQPVLAAQLGQRKAENIRRTRCDLVALGNIGCMVQIEQHLRHQSPAIPVLHTIQILDRAYRGISLTQTETSH